MTARAKAIAIANAAVRKLSEEAGIPTAEARILLHEVLAGGGK